MTIRNHDPQPLTRVGIDYLRRNPASVAKNRPCTMDEPSRTIPAVMYKGVPYGLFYPYNKGDDRLSNTQRPLLDALLKLPPNGLTSIELFAGGGLMRLGIEHAGITTIWANDFDKGACRAHEYNFGDGSIVHGDITQIDVNDIPDADLVVGGPPCQSWSNAGKGLGDSDPRGKLVWRYLEIIAAKQPKAFLFENVKGLIGKKHRHVFDALCAEFECIGYRVSWKLLNSWDWGVAQKRERVFIVGVRNDLGFTYTFPQSEYDTTGYRPVLRDAIGDLPEPIYNNTTMPLTESVYRHAREKRIGYNNSLDKPSYTIRAKPEDILDLSNCTEIHPGVDNHDGHEIPSEVFLDCANHTERDYWTPKSDYTYDQANRVQQMEAPSATIPAHHNSGQPIHPTHAPRRFTVRECLRLMSVPDTYILPDVYNFGKKDGLSLSAQYRIVGNGVPSRVAYHLAKSLSEQLLR